MKKIILIILLPFYLFSYSSILDTVKIDEIIIKNSINVSNTTPFSFTNVTKSNIDNLSNKELSYILSTTPSITFQSDNGTNLGYTYYRLRGIDQTRLNITINGIPLNEPEDQGSYSNNFPSMLQVVDNIQIIKGSGLNKTGTANFGGSINFETIGNLKPFVHGSYSLGNNNTRISSITINKKLFFVNVNKLYTDGYKNNSFNNSWSTNYGVNLNNFRIFGMLSQQINGMSWTGETLEQIEIDPRYNSNKPWEKDYFLNTHNQFTYSINGFNFSLFHQYQNGLYDTEMSLFDPSLYEEELISRIKLNYNWFGAIFSRLIEFDDLAITYGLSYDRTIRNHEGIDNFRNALYYPYKNRGDKESFSQYVKSSYKLNNFTFYGDIKNRYVRHQYISEDFNFDLYNKNIINFSGGLSYKLMDGIFKYGFGVSQREPRRSDILGGFDNYDGELNLLTEEKVFSQDFGYKHYFNNLHLEINFYNMKFKNELMPTGFYGVNGVSLYSNIPNSYRRGIEFTGNYKNKIIDIVINSTLSQNKFSDNYNSLLSPNFISNINIKYNIIDNFYISLLGRYNSYSYIDLDNLFKLPEYYVLDGILEYNISFIEAKINFNNILNTTILTSGVIGFDGSPRYFVLSNFSNLFTLKFKI